MAVDYMKNELQVGDEVIFMNINYRDFNKGIIKKISPKKVTIRYIKFDNYETTTMQYHDQVIKIEGK